MHSEIKSAWPTAVKTRCRGPRCELRVDVGENGKTLTIIDVDKYSEIIKHRASKCDYLIFLTNDKIVAAAVELKSGNFHGNQVLNQLQSGAQQISGLSDKFKFNVEKFLPILLHGSIRHASELKILRQKKVSFKRETTLSYSGEVREQIEQYIGQKPIGSTMTNRPTSEKAFEDSIEAYLIEYAGYTKADNHLFDPELALDKHTLLAFLKETQPDALDTLKASYGSNLEDAIVKRIAAECDRRGLLDVVRNGVRDRGQHLHLSYFRPPTRLNPETELRYRQNRLTVMRQVRYDPDSKHTIDLLLSLNGLPIATVELKNAFTGQRTGHAIQQYIKDRVPTTKTPLIQFKKRALVHFAVDTDEAYMTTRLSGKQTFFLPFNTGDQGGKGNPDTHSRIRPATKPATCGKQSGSATVGSTSSTASSTYTPKKAIRPPKRPSSSLATTNSPPSAP